jgi:hypothetical protein
VFGGLPVSNVIESIRNLKASAKFMQVAIWRGLIAGAKDNKTGITFDNPPLSNLKLLKLIALNFLKLVCIIVVCN